MSQLMLPTEIGTKIYPHGDPEGTVVELTPEGWVNQRNDYVYVVPEWSIAPMGFDVL